MLALQSLKGFFLLHALVALSDIMHCFDLLDVSGDGLVHGNLIILLSFSLVYDLAIGHVKVFSVETLRSHVQNHAGLFGPEAFFLRNVGVDWKS